MADNDEDEDSNIAASECLGAIQTILDSISKTPHLYPSVEQALFPLLDKLISDKEAEFLEETLKILSFITYYSQTISEQIWSLFPRLCSLIDTCGIDFIDDLLTPLDNLVSRGTDVFLSGPYPNMIFDLYKKCLVHDEVSEGNRAEGAKLAEVMMLNCRGRIDQYIEPFMELAIHRLPSAKKIELRVTLIGVLANASYYNPVLFLHILESKGWTKDVFTLWLSLISQLAKPHEKKLSILALSSLLTIPLSSLPNLVQLGIKQILDNIISLGLSLDEQKLRIGEEAKQKEVNTSDDEGDDGELPDEDDPNDATNFEELANKATQYYKDAADDDEDEDEEGSDDIKIGSEDLDDYDSEDEDEFDSPIDTVDELVYFVDIMKTLSSADVGSYQKLMGLLDENTRANFESVVIKSDFRRAELLRLQQEKLQNQQ